MTKQLTNKPQPLREVRRQVREWLAQREQVEAEIARVEARIAAPDTWDMMRDELPRTVRRLRDRVAELTEKIERRMAEYGLTMETITADPRYVAANEKREAELEALVRRIRRKWKQTNTTEPKAALALPDYSEEQMRAAHDRAHHEALRAAEQERRPGRKKAAYEAAYDDAYYVEDESLFD